MIGYRFKTFDFYRNDLLNVFELWDRTKGVTRSPPTPTNQSEEDHIAGALAAGAKKSVQKKDKGIFIYIFSELMFIFLGNNPDAKDKDKSERLDDTAPSSTPNQQSQQQQVSSGTPTNFVREERFFKGKNE